MGEKEIELDSDLEESIRKIAREVLDEQITKIKFREQIQRTVRERIGENESVEVPVQEIRRVVKLVLQEYTGIGMMIGGGSSAIFSVAISLYALNVAWMFAAIMNQMIFTMAIGFVFFLVGFLIVDNAKKKFSELINSKLGGPIS
ncbi:MAG: hypothetical protein E4H14_14955 [Candidatus Thorarchaeota archaeon]|nr:MAG: hypothetical protein E4H14_14955 [Candidatus Thorarchaeota archaeon]